MASSIAEQKPSLYFNGKKYSIIDVPSDGNCYYHCIVLSNFVSHIDSSFSLRKLLYDFAAEHENQFNSLKIFPCKEALKKNGEWANLDCIILTAACLNVRIITIKAEKGVLTQTFDSSILKLERYFSNCIPGDRTITLLHCGNGENFLDVIDANHYRLLVEQMAGACDHEAVDDRMVPKEIENKVSSEGKELGAGVNPTSRKRNTLHNFFQKRTCSHDSDPLKKKMKTVEAAPTTLKTRVQESAKGNSEIPSIDCNSLIKTKSGDVLDLKNCNKTLLDASKTEDAPMSETTLSEVKNSTQGARQFRTHAGWESKAIDLLQKLDDVIIFANKHVQLTKTTSETINRVCKDQLKESATALQQQISKLCRDYPNKEVKDLMKNTGEIHKIPLHSIEKLEDFLFEHSLTKKVIAVHTEGSEDCHFWSCNLCKIDMKPGSSNKWPKVVKHLLSKGHMNHVKDFQTSLCTGRQIRNLVQEHRTEISLSELSEYIKTNICIFAAQASQSFAFASKMADFIQVVVNTILKGEEIPLEELRQLESVPRTKHLAISMNTLFRSIPSTSNVGGGGKLKKPLTIDRRTVSDVLERTANRILKLKKNHIDLCEFIGLIIDESTSTSNTAPIYCGIMGATNNFEWLNTFVGQKETAGIESNAELLTILKQLFSEIGAWRKQRSFGSDGAHKMRSNRTFEGVDAAGVKGNSFTSHLQRELDIDLPGRNPLKFHCALHILNLAVGDALSSFLKSEWIPFIRGVYAYFSCSAKRSDAFSRLGEKNSSLLEKHLCSISHTESNYAPKMMIKFKLYCATRWLGVYNCTDALVRSWPILEEFISVMIQDGYGAMNKKHEDMEEILEYEESMHQPTVIKFSETELKLEVLERNDELAVLEAQAPFLKKGTEVQALRGRRYYNAVVDENYGNGTFRLFFRANRSFIDQYPLSYIKPMDFLTCDRCKEEKIDVVMAYQCKDCDVDVCDVCIEKLKLQVLHAKKNNQKEGGKMKKATSLSISCAQILEEINTSTCKRNGEASTEKSRDCKRHLNILDSDEIFEKERIDFQNQFPGNVPENKQTILLNKVFGLNSVNYGRTFYMHTFLGYYTTLMKRFQTTLQPVQHKASRWLGQFYRQCKIAFVDSSVNEDLWPSPYAVFRSQQKLEGKFELLYAMDHEAKCFVQSVITNIKERLHPYFAYYQAMEIIDPCISDENFEISTTGTCRDALIDICNRHNIVFAEVILQIASLRASCDSFTKEQKRNADQNLLLFYRELHATNPSTYKELFSFARAVFSIPIVTVTIETLFSRMGSNKTDVRSSLRDETVANILHVNSLKKTAQNEYACLEKNLQLDYDMSFNHRLQ